MKIIDKRTRSGRVLSIRMRDNWIRSIVMSICFPPLARAVAVFHRIVSSSPEGTDGRTDRLIFDFVDLVPRYETYRAREPHPLSFRAFRSQDHYKDHFLPGGTLWNVDTN